jgi:hypothetical protein
MSPVTKDAQRTPKPKIPKRKLLKKSKKSKHPHDGGKKIKPKNPTRARGLVSCPKCSSTNLFSASDLPGLWSVWECKRCGYRGTFIVQNGKLAEKVREGHVGRTLRH